MATATIGTMQEFQPGAEPIMAYLERLQAYLDANEIAQAKRASVLVSTIGHKTYAILRSLTAPETPQSKSYDSLVLALKTHYQPKRLIIAERSMFNQRSQHPEESITLQSCDASQRLATSAISWMMPCAIASCVGYVAKIPDAGCLPMPTEPRHSQESLNSPRVLSRRIKTQGP